MRAGRAYRRLDKSGSVRPRGGFPSKDVPRSESVMQKFNVVELAQQHNAEQGHGRVTLVAKGKQMEAANR